MAFVKRGHGNAFIQEDPAEEMMYLTSTGVGDINIPRRPRSIVYDPDIQRSGEWKATDKIRGEPGELTAPLQRPLSTVNNYLQEIECAFTLRINWACRGDRSIVWNYEVAAILVDAEFEAGSIGQPVIAAPADEDRVQTTGDTKALDWSYIYLLSGVQHTVDDTENILNVACVQKECGDRCGRRIDRCTECYAVRESGGYLTGDSVLITTDGQTWAETDTDPFLGARNPTDVIIVETATGYRVIVTGSELAGAPASVSYSDTLGVTWVDVELGATNNQGLNAISRDDLGRVWVVADDGFVYVSGNLGMTWTISHTGGDITAASLNGIAFVDQYLAFVVGDGNAMMYTPDGGTSWIALVGPAVGQNLTAVDTNRSGHVYVVTNNARIYRSIDDGANWDLVLSQPSGGMTDIEFDSKLEYVGYVSWNNAAGVGVILRSEDGGVTWLAWDTPTSTGLNGLSVCDPNSLYTVGDDGYIAKFVRSAG